MLDSTRYLSYIYLVLSVIVLGLYGIIVSPDIATLPYRYTFATLITAFVLVAIIKLMLEKRIVDEAPLLHRPSRQFRFDFMLYLAAGIFIALGLVLIFNLTYTDGLRMLFGALTMGYFASLDNTLCRENEWFKTNEIYTIENITIIPISNKLSLFLTLIILLIAVVTPLTVLKDANIFSGAAKQGPVNVETLILDISFLLGVILVFALRLIHSYSENIHYIMNSHIQAMIKVEAGDTEQHVPILTRDEFGLMAHQTNQLILQLQNREHFIEGMEELIHEQEQLIQEKDQLRQTLEKIVSPNILEKLLTTDDQTLKQGQEYDVAILFCDLREFTNFTETSSAEDVIFFLNSYFSEIVRIVSEHHGLVNKFMGDAILAVYGLEESPSPVDDAVNTSWAILEHARNIQTPGGEHMDIGVGIHYGQVMAGTIGSEDRFEYTFIGDAVNTASRLDGLSKRLGHKIIISRKAYLELAEETREKFTDLEMHTLRGKKEPVHVYGAVQSEPKEEL